MNWPNLEVESLKIPFRVVCLGRGWYSSDVARGIKARPDNSFIAFAKALAQVRLLIIYLFSYLSIVIIDMSIKKVWKKCVQIIDAVGIFNLD